MDFCHQCGNVWASGQKDKRRIYRPTNWVSAKFGHIICEYYYNPSLSPKILRYLNKTDVQLLISCEVMWPEGLRQDTLACNWKVIRQDRRTALSYYTGTCWEICQLVDVVKQGRHIGVVVQIWQKHHRFKSDWYHDIKQPSETFSSTERRFLIFFFIYWESGLSCWYSPVAGIVGCIKYFVLILWMRFCQSAFCFWVWTMTMTSHLWLIPGATLCSCSFFQRWQ